MRCSECGHDNPEKARFCMECGNALVLKCSNCDEPMPEKAKFCMSCGHKAGPAKAAPSAPARDRLAQYIPPQLLAKLQSAQQSGGMQGERRVVTMLFCDVQGSTAAAERLDPEDWAEIMNGAFEHLIAPVYRYEGTLARLMGDAVLAFFGAPIAHEDDPERAVLAGLAIVREIEPYAKQIARKWGIDLAVRVGINTGLVVVGEVGTDMRLEYTAMGDAVNLAARMESTAQPGTVQIADSTQKRVAPLFELEALGPIEVKGKAEPVEAHAVLRPKAKPGRLRGIEGLDSPMVGRDRELAAMRGRVDALRRGAGQVCAIMAEAGLGKSRLAAELRKQLASEGVLEELRWLEGRALSYQTTTPYAALEDLLRQLLESDADPAADEAARYAALDTRVRELVGNADAPAFTPFLASRLGIAVQGDSAERMRYLDPPDLRRQTEAAVVDFFEKLSESHPLVLVFEDLHWADPSTLEMLPALMKLSERAAVMLLGILRPRPQDPSWKFHEVGARDFSHRYLCVQLEPLADDEARELVANLLRIEGLPERLRALILQKAEGNPFFVEEVIRSLIDSRSIVQDGDHWRATAEISNIKVPDTLAALLTTRLDRLDERTKLVAQTAAVIGRQFDFDTLASIRQPTSAVEDALAELQRRGLVRERSRRPQRTYTFKHVLTQAAAYDSLLLKTRRELHKQVADVTVRIAPEHSGEIARHYIEAREPALALPHLIEAAEAASRAYATQEALSHFEQALSIIAELEHPDLSLARRAFEGMGNARQFVLDVPGALDNYDRMYRFAETNKDVSMMISALNKRAFVTTLFIGDVEAGERLLDEAKVLAEEIDCRAGMTEGCMIRCAVYTAQADFEAAYRYLDQGIALGDEMQAEEPMLYGRTHIANTMILMTEFDRAWPRIEETLALADKLGNRKYVADLKSFAYPTFMFNRGRGAEGVTALREALEIGEQIGATVAVSSSGTMLARMMAYCGQIDDAVAYAQRGLASAQQTGIPFQIALCQANLGASYLHVSEQLHPRMVEAHERALALMNQPLGSVYAAMVFCELGFGALALGKYERALELFELGITTRSAPILICRPHLRIGTAMARLGLGEPALAAEAAREARTFAEEHGLRMYEPWLPWADAFVAKGLGKSDDAIARFEESEQKMAASGMRHYVWQCALESSHLLRAAGNPEAAASKRDRAQSMVAEIVAGIQDPSLREMYRGDAARRLQA